MDPKLLQEIGLTQGETRVYLALLNLGATTTGPLALKAGVSTSKVYKILDRLIKKGLAGSIVRSKTKYFSAMEPKRLLEYLDEAEQSLQLKKETVIRIIPQLEMEQKLAGKKTVAIVYEGFKAVTNLFRNVIDELNKGECYYVLGAGYGDVPGLRAFFYGHHTRRAKKVVVLKMLANYNTKDNLEKTTYKNAEIKFLPQYLISNMEIVFYKNKAFIVIWAKTPIGFLIEDEEVVKGFRKYFNAFWKIAKK